jgi:hypothetical protein
MEESAAPQVIASQLLVSMTTLFICMTTQAKETLLLVKHVSYVAWQLFLVSRL